MLKKLFTNRSSFTTFIIKRLSFTQSNGDLGDEMKSLNDNKQFEKALDLFNKYKIKTNEQYSNWSIIQALRACTEIGDLQCGSHIHNLVSSRLKYDPYILPSLIHFYMQCGDVNRAQSLFDTSTNKTLFIYGAMMKGYIKNKLANKAIDLFKQIKNPDKVIFVLFFNACAQVGTIETLHLVKHVASNIPKHFYSDTYILTSLIDSLMTCGDQTYAQLLFENAKLKTLPMYGAMMKGYIKNNSANMVIELFKQIKNPNEIITNLLFNACAQLGTDDALNVLKKVSSNIPKTFYSNRYIATSLIDGLIKCGDIKSAQTFFETFQMKTLSMYGAMMNGFNMNNMAAETIKLFNQIRQDQFYTENDYLYSKKGIDSFEQNVIIYLCLIKALAQVAILSTSQSIVKRIPTSYLTHRQIENALIDMWGKSAYVDEAKRIFKNMSQPDQIGYTAMINCYGLNGMGNEAVELFRQMPTSLINDYTYVCVLNACSHSGLVDIARSIFNTIQTKSPIIYTTMVDCFSRSAAFEQAENLINQFERDHVPVLPMHMALLSGVRNEKNRNLSEKIFNRMKKQFPDVKNSLVPASILLANVCATSGDSEKASEIKHHLYRSGAKKRVGITVTELNGELLQFRAHDQSHPRSVDIYAEINRISQELIDHGHEYDASWIVRSMRPDETIESILCGHSERLAIAVHFIDNQKPKRIQLTKNLRICGDCHRATKLIAAIRQCHIIVRDANRIHHFQPNGQCSCQDYF